MGNSTMAGQVELQLGDIPDVEIMNKCGLFTSSEIRGIMRKRKLFENKLQKVSKAKEDTLRCITFEIELLMKVKLKAKEKGLQQKAINLEYSMANRISKLYYFALRRFPSDCKIWLSFVKFCKHMKLYTCVSRIFDQMLELHCDKPVLFKMAANWEFYECHSIERARKFILNGLHTHKDCKLLFAEAFRIELSYTNQKLEQAKGNEESGKNNSLVNPVAEMNFAEVIYTSAVNQINDVFFLVDLLNIAQEFTFTSSLKDEIIERMKNKHPKEEITWDTLARRELTLDGTLQKKIGRCVSVYEDALRKVPTRKMWSFYLSYVLELNEDNTILPIFKNNCLKKAFEVGHKENMLSEKHYLLWVKKIDNVDPCMVLKWGTERLGSSYELWSWRLRYHLSKSDEEGAMAVFKEIISTPDIPNKANLWMLVLKCYQILDTAKAESLWKEGVNDPTVGMALKGRYIEWLAMSKGIGSARKAYSTISTTPPLSLDLHETMSKVEDAQPKVSMKYTRQVYETAVNQFGKSKTDVWIWYLKFETKYGDKERALKIYDQAIKTLDSKLIDVFISEYQLSEAGIMNNDRENSSKNPKGEITWNALARRELELTGTLEERIGKCISVYEDGLRNVPTKKMWSLYLDYIIEINEDLSTLSTFKKNCLKNAFEAAHKKSMLSENHYLFWITKLDNVDTCKVLQWGTEKFGTSNKLWAMRLRSHLSKCDEVGAMAVFKEIISHPNIPDKASLWMLILEYYQIADITKAENLWNEGVNDPIVAAVLKGRYIEWLAVTRGIMAARKAYSTLSTTPPFSLDIHVAMSKLEDAQPKVDVKYARKVYETAVNQYGKSNTDVWMWYVKFESKFGKPDLVPRIYEQALKTLNNDLVDVFISEFHLHKAETMNNDRPSSNNETSNGA
nr:U3 small nucleolar RNA-associated protein 6 homolog isoform X2 [Halyomorpha halys]